MFTMTAYVVFMSYGIDDDGNDYEYVNWQLKMCVW